MRFTQHNTRDTHMTSFMFNSLKMWKEGFLHQFVHICWMGKAPVLYRSGAHQQCQWRQKISLVNLGSLTHQYIFDQLLFKKSDSPRSQYFKNCSCSSCLSKHENAYIQKSGRFITCHPQTDRSPFESFTFFLPYSSNYNFFLFLINRLAKYFWRFTDYQKCFLIQLC